MLHNELCALFVGTLDEFMVAAGVGSTLDDYEGKGDDYRTSIYKP